jgi:hypothetical protein
MIEALLLTLAGMITLPLGALMAAGLAVAVVEAVEFASLMLFLLLVTGGRKAGRL